MELVTLHKMVIHGVTTRTTNADETVAESQKIAPLWQRFMGLYGEQIINKQPAYGVYYGYESNMDGAYSVMVGFMADGENGGLIGDGLESITLAPGNYLHFHAQGEMPQSVVGLWQEIWQYFAAPSCPYTRQYLTDFECYPSGDSVDIYIGVHTAI
ncbi:transcriptional regulator [Shewanella colwelliana]|uniref:Transcriptional regulator n=1 Tax=Shewanella colwelliana TaxID=23 RepID=A0A1E5IXW7_SHECO|nr:GyrI-like domain-containing protein [Shewanella colwelliana]OEG75395.1 transcriptional regulator [Shewanella colwelliana]GIU36000.1 transcriptional regulator [Shewanella colwelliana]